MPESTAHNAFAEAAKEYLKTGLGNPIPLPVGQKHPVPSGYTSDDGKVVTDDQIDKWIAAGRFGKDKKTGRPHIIGNVGIHLTETIVGLDVDDYPKTNKDGTPKLNKAGEPIVATGAATLKTLIDAHGPLPETYISTARGEPERSGIRLYRVPAGMQAKFSGIAGPGIDVIRQRHRYMAVAPSGNPDTGTRYEWSGLDIETGSEWPSIDQIPDLPEAWLNHLLAKKRCSCGVGGVKSKAEKQHEDGQVHESETLFHSPAEAAAALGAALGDGMNRHDVATTVTLALVRYEELGRAGATEELERLRELFVDALDGERDEDPGDEWDRMVDGARSLVEESPSDTGAGREGASSPDVVKESWRPVDLAKYVKEHGMEPPEADSFFRRDGYGMGYRGMVNVIFGDPGAGKSMIMMAGPAVTAIRNAARKSQGKVVVWIDYEDTPRIFLARLVKILGVPLEDATNHAHYIRPEGSVTGTELRELLKGVVTDETELIVIDSVNESMATYNYDPISTKDATLWRQAILKPIQSAAGNAAIWTIDHTPQNTDSKRRYAFGAQGKLAGVQGAQLRADVVEQPMPGEDGAVALYVTKDRNGDVRSHARKSESPIQLVATAMFNPVPTRGEKGLAVTFIEPQGGGIDDVELSGFIEKMLNETEKGLSPTQIRSLVRAEGYQRRDEVISGLVNEIVAADKERYEAIPKGNGVAYRVRADAPETEG